MSRLSSGLGKTAAACMVLAVLGAAGCTSALPGSSGVPGLNSPSHVAPPTPRVTLSLPTQEPTEEATEAPTPTAAPSDGSPSAGELMGVCSNFAAPGAAAYNKGRSHPLIVVDNGGASYLSFGDYDINARFTDDSWPTPIQLVLCVGTDVGKNVSNCGTYKRVSDGKKGTVLSYRHTVTVTVKLARTAKTLQTKVLTGSTPKCTQTMTVDWGANPPWRIYGSTVSTAAINTYATAVSVQLSK
jgi:hypothetical protein